jgi:hypothetical protein
MDFLISDLRLILHLLIAGKPFGRSDPAMNTKLLLAGTSPAITTERFGQT